MTNFDLLIRNGYVVDPANHREGRFDLAVKQDKVALVEPEIDPSQALRTYEAEGCLVLPGLVDTHVHLTPSMRAAGFHMLAKAGVTTALDCAGPVEAVLDGMARQGSGINIAALNRLTPNDTLSSANASRKEVEEYLERSLAEGAFGIKLLGGHLPLSPETTAAAIQAANDEGCYTAFHCGTTNQGSNLLGLLEAFDLADQNRLQICHVNAYCRGLTHGSPVEESLIALRELSQRRFLVSESHMGPLNCCWSRIGEDGQPKSHVARTCLKSGGYSIDKDGILAAARDGYLKVQRAYPGNVVYLTVAEGVDYLLAQDFENTVSFPVNKRSTAFLCATEKDETNNFIVTALSTDGGAIPRNFLLSHGLSLVRFDALSLSEFVLKASRVPACMLGLFKKGHLAPGADADIVVVDSQTQTASLTIASGQVIMADGLVLGKGGTLLTTARGTKALSDQGVIHQVVDLSGSLLYGNPDVFPA